jgi:hypothetical protein
MKKFTTLLLLFVSPFTLFACSSQPNAVNQKGQNASTEQNAAVAQAAPFTLDFGNSETEIKSFTENDSFGTIADAGPLYVGGGTYVQPVLQQFQQAKTAFVGQLMTSVDQTMTDAASYETDLKNLRDKYLGYMSVVLWQNQKDAQEFKDMANDILAPQIRYTTDRALYLGTDTTSTSMDSAVLALMQYHKVYLALDAVNQLTQDTSQTVSGLLALEDAAQASSDSQTSALAAQIESEVPSMVDALGVKLAGLQQEGANIGLSLKQINTGEHYIGLASVQYMDDTLKSLQPSIDGLKPTGPFTADDIASIKELGKQYAAMSAEVKTALDKSDPSELVAYVPAQRNSLVPLAYADDEEGYGQKALGFLKSAGQATVAAGKFGWEAAKTTFHVAKTVTGVTLDTLGAGTKSGFDAVFGAANGNSLNEITSEISNNFAQIGSNFQKGQSGSQILGDAKDYFNYWEKTGGDAVEGLVENYTGKGWTSWLAGKAGSLTVNLFTAFGKGVTKVANLQSTNGEIAEGALDIGLSLIGGSKVIASGTQVVRGSAETLELFGEGGINLLDHAISNSELKDLKTIAADLLENTKLTPAQVETLISNSKLIEVEQGIKASLNAVSGELDHELGQMIKEGGETLLENLAEGKEEFTKYIYHEFENSLPGVFDGVKSVLGKDFEAYVNNVIGAHIDDIIKEKLKEKIDEDNIEGIESYPPLKDLAGKWNGGSLVITDVVASDEFKQEAQKEGCDLSNIEAEKGKSQPMDIGLNPTSDNGGTMPFTTSDGKTQSIPFTYKDGVITATYSSQGAAMTMNLNVTEDKGVYKISGPMDINYKDGALKITANMGASKPAPAEPTTPIVMPNVSNPVAPGTAAPTVDLGQPPASAAPAGDDSGSGPPV